jgi:hypothetical protein
LSPARLSTKPVSVCVKLSIGRDHFIFKGMQSECASTLPYRLARRDSRHIEPVVAATGG